MASLLLRFHIGLENYDLPFPDYLDVNGPKFHRWLPDGENDAIPLPTKDPSTHLKVWFERQGVVVDGLIKFKPGEHQVDTTIIPRQAVLDGGPLYGSLEINGLSSRQLALLRKGNFTHRSYLALEKRAAKVICPHVAQFINILRTNYGQYWIAELPRWDSRREPIDFYCVHTLHLEWSHDKGKSWTRFQWTPGKGPSFAVYLTANESFKEYLTKEGWQEIADAAAKGYEPRPAAFFLAGLHSHFDQGNLKYAFIEGVIALELALNDFVRERLEDNAALKESVQTFWKLPLPAQLTIVISALGGVNPPVLELVCEAIETRNKIIHEGRNPSQSAVAQLVCLRSVVVHLMSGPKFRFPEANHGNALMSEKDWEQALKEQQ